MKVKKKMGFVARSLWKILRPAVVAYVEHEVDRRIRSEVYRLVVQGEKS